VTETGEGGGVGGGGGGGGGVGVGGLGGGVGGELGGGGGGGVGGGICATFVVSDLPSKFQIPPSSSNSSPSFLSPPPLPSSSPFLHITAGHHGAKVAGRHL